MPEGAALSWPLSDIVGLENLPPIRVAYRNGVGSRSGRSSGMIGAAIRNRPNDGTWRQSLPLLGAKNDRFKFALTSDVRGLASHRFVRDRRQVGLRVPQPDFPHRRVLNIGDHCGHAGWSASSFAGWIVGRTPHLKRQGRPLAGPISPGSRACCPRSGAAPHPTPSRSARRSRLSETAPPCGHRPQAAAG